MDDRISQLPIPILHHILCFLSQKEAVRTCRLSKQWRHIGSTRPNLEFSDKWFDVRQERFVSVLGRTLQAYSDQNLSIHKLHLHLSWVSLRVISLLDQWIPKIAALNIKAFKLNFHSFFPTYYKLPRAVFLAESLEELHLCYCKLSPVEGVRFKRLRTLTLEEVQVDDDGTVEKITSGCPLLSRLVINNSWELRNVRRSEATFHGLNHFGFWDFMKIKGRSIEINVPNLEKVSIKGPWIWCHRQRALLFSHLTSLHLHSVILSSESLDLLSFGCPALASLTLHSCSGFEEFHLTSDSVKYLRISTSNILLKGVRICAPNIVRFDFTAAIPLAPETFSFTTHSQFWYSKVILYSCVVGPDFDVNSWFLKLRQMLKPLSGSRIDLILQINHDMPCGAVDGSSLLSDEPPVFVENFDFSTRKCHEESWYLGFTNDLFRVCRPRHIGWRMLSYIQFNFLLLNKNLVTEPCFWQQDLEQVFVETLDGQQWQLMQWPNLGELRNRKQAGKIRLRLKV